MATVSTRPTTADEFYKWVNQPENRGRLWELDRGEVVEMPPPGELHGVVCFLVSHVLGNFVFRRGRGYVCSNDTGLLVESGPDTVRGPDLMLFEEKRRLDEVGVKFVTRVPVLVVEVLSPSDQQTATNRRISQYLRRGVRLVWLVDPQVRSVTIYRPDAAHTVLDEGEELTGNGALPEFRCRVAELFTMPGEGESPANTGNAPQPSP